MGTEHEDIVQRLRTFGTQPIDTGLADRHASFMGAATPVTPIRSRRRPAMIGALMAGLVLGGTGLAAALPGSLPEQASSVAKSALEAVNLAGHGKSDEAAAGKDDKDAKDAKDQENSSDSNMKVGRFLTGCTAGTPPTAFTGTHGQYVKAHPDDPATANVNERQVAAQSDCGKPLSSLEANSNSSDDKDAKDESEDTEGSGKPADAGRPASPGKSEEEHPPAVAENEQGSEHRSTDTGQSGDAGKSAEHRPEGVGHS